MTLEEYRNQQHEIDLVFFHGIFKTQNAHGGRNVMPRCLSEGVDIFLKSAAAVSLFNRNFTPGDVTSSRDVPFAVGVRGVYGNPTLRAMHPIHKCVAKGAPLTNIFLTDLPCPVSPRADPHRCVRSDHRKRSAYR